MENFNLASTHQPNVRPQVRPQIRLRLAEIDFCAWLGQASPDDRLEYHRGFLAMDASQHCATLPDQDRRELDRLARRAWWAAERGLVHLVQRRHRSDDYSYLAVARPNPKQASVSLSSLLLTEVA
jgi:hypothetical protein